jgi:DNA-binding beta-propeller fold protein YncE
VVLGTVILVGGLAAGVCVGGDGFIRHLLGRAPEQIRGLPGVRAIEWRVPPQYASSLFGLDAPLSVAVTTDGEFIYVAEGTGARFVRKVRVADGGSVAELAPPNSRPGVRKPVSVAVAPGSGLVYVVDRLRNAVDIYNPEGDWLGLLAEPASDGWAPLSVDADVDGNLYVTSTAAEGPNLVVYSADGKIIEVYQTVAADGLAVSYPSGVAVDRDGLMLIGDSNNARIVGLERGARGSDGRSWGAAQGEFALPRGVVFDGRGYFLVVDSTDHTISAWELGDNGASLLFRFGTAGIDDGAFLFPNDIAIDDAGTLYIADRDNDRVQIWRY